MSNILSPNLNPKSDIELKKLDQDDKTENNSNIEDKEEIDLDSFPADSQKSTTFDAGVNLFKSYIGAGILALPYIFFKTGYLLSSAFMLLTAVLVYYSTTLMFELAKTQKQPVSFTNIFRNSLGNTLTNVYKFFMAVYILGLCVSYTIFFTDFFQIAFNTQNMPSYRIIFACFSLIIIIPLSLVNNFHFFVKFSNMGNALIIATLIAILGLVFSEMTGKDLTKNETDLANFESLPSFIGVSIFAFECIGNIFPIKNSMQEPQKFGKVFRNISIVTCIIYILFSVFCCLAFGSKINQIILIDLEKVQSFFYLFQAFYAVALILSYPIQFYPLALIVEDIPFVRKFILLNRKNFLKRNMFRLGLTGIIFAFGFLIPKFAAFLNLIGAFAGTNIQFVFPILAYQVYFKGKISRRKSALNVFCLAAGVIGSCFAIIDSMKELTQ